MWKEEFAIRTNVNEMRQLLKDGKILLLFDHGQIAGSVVCNPFYAKEDEKIMIGELGMLCVQEAQLGKGYGKQLLIAAEQRCLEQGCV